MLMDKINVICCVLGSIAVTIFGGFMILNIVLYKGLKRLVVE